jgi:hypothetical protein
LKNANAEEKIFNLLKSNKLNRLCPRFEWKLDYIDKQKIVKQANFRISSRKEDWEWSMADAHVFTQTHKARKRHKNNTKTKTGS